MKVFALILGLCLTGCISHDHHGHYKVNENIVKKGETKKNIINKFGTPFILNQNNNVFYYMYSKVKKYSIGTVDEKETKIIRIVFENDILKEYSILEYSDYSPNEKRTPEPEMRINVFSELVGGIGNIAGADSISESSKSFKQAESKQKD